MKVRSITRPTTACCTLPQYMGFLISEPKSSTCTRLAEVTGISHHSANRFLHRENYQPKDMFDEAVEIINPTSGTLSVDDTVLDKPYSYLWHLSVIFGLVSITDQLKASTSSPFITPTYQGYTCRWTTGYMTSRKARPKTTISKKCWMKCRHGDWSQCS